MTIRSVTTPATSRRLVSVDTARIELSQDSSADPLIGRLIDQASAVVESMIGRWLAYEVVVESWSGNGRLRATLARRPIESIVGVHTLDAQGARTDTLLSTTYRLEDKEAGFLAHTSGGWLRSAESFGWTIESNPGQRGLHNYEAEYGGGYWLPEMTGSKPAGVEVLPADISAAALVLVSQFFRRKGADLSIASEKIGDYAVAFASHLGAESQAKTEARLLIAPYTEWI